MLKTIDLFAGAGGLSLGFQQTGKFEIVAAAEINENARKTYQLNISANNPNFIFINNVVGYDFRELNETVSGIDVVIGGPPCQGFSNANRQKNHLISMNNGLVKEYFRAIKEIRPRAFVMENVSMLRSDTHRFYESHRDNEEIDTLISQGYSIPKRQDVVLIADCSFEGIDYSSIDTVNLNDIALPATLAQLISVLNKNKTNPRRLPNFIVKNSKELLKLIDLYISEIAEPSETQEYVIARLHTIASAIKNNNIAECFDALNEITKREKMIATVKEIKQNELIGTYQVKDDGSFIFKVNSYSVIDYINAILGDEYVQAGGTVNAEWFGVPQERRRYIVIGVRKDLCNKEQLVMPTAPKDLELLTVADAISDLKDYAISYESHHCEITYQDDADISAYALLMRAGSTGVNNHITTKTTDVALERFKSIRQGKNFHSLDATLKGTYSKPERTQNTIYLRLDPSKPSGTVVNVRKSMWIHPELNRAITVREAARLQSFPDKFVFVGTKDSQYQQVGNAVPPLLAEGIAHKILEIIK